MKHISVFLASFCLVLLLSGCQKKPTGLMTQEHKEPEVKLTAATASAEVKRQTDLKFKNTSTFIPLTVQYVNKTNKPLSNLQLRLLTNPSVSAFGSQTAKMNRAASSPGVLVFDIGSLTPGEEKVARVALYAQEQTRADVVARITTSDGQTLMDSNPLSIQVIEVE
jgi:hypothetical protein